MRENISQNRKDKAQFLKTLKIILESQENKRIVKFDEERHKITILSRSRFVKILPKYFRHSNFCSFTRQLYWLGFRRAKHSFNIQFTNEELRNGKTLMDLESKRKYRQRKSQKMASQCPQFQQIEQMEQWSKNNEIIIEQKIEEIQQKLETPFVINPSFQNFSYTSNMVPLYYINPTTCMATPFYIVGNHFQS